jgi:hypothetical protein
MISGGDPYEIVDSALMPWAERNGIRITKLYRDDYVRSFWMFSRGGEVRAQLWLNIPDPQGQVTVIAAALDSSSPTKWGPREERRATLSTLVDVLDELRAIVFKWAGPGSFT